MRSSPDVVSSILLVWVGSSLFLLRLWAGLDGLLLLGLGLSAVVLAALGRDARFFVPGGILLGLGLGIFVTGHPDLSASVAEEWHGNLFLRLFGLGWLLITPLARLFGREAYYWTLVPALLLSLLGFNPFGWRISLDILRVMNDAWQLALIALGMFVYLRRQAPENPEDDPEDDGDGLGPSSSASGSSL